MRKVLIIVTALVALAGNAAAGCHHVQSTNCQAQPTESIPEGQPTRAPHLSTPTPVACQ